MLHTNNNKNNNNNNNNDNNNNNNNNKNNNNNNNNNKILIEGPTQGLDDTAITEKEQFSIDIPRSKKKFCLSLHYN